MQKKDGTVQDIIIGEKEDDPVLVISDLLIHLSQQQIEKKAGVVVEGEGLDILVATKPLTGNDELEKEEKELVKAAVVQFLKENLDMEEERFPLSRTGDRAGRKGKRLRTGQKYGDRIRTG